MASATTSFAAEVESSRSQMTTSSCIDSVDVVVLQSHYAECIKILDNIRTIATRGEEEDIVRVTEEVTKACAEFHSMKNEYQKNNSLRKERIAEWEKAVAKAEEVLNGLKASGKQRQTANDELKTSHDTLTGEIQNQEELIIRNRQTLEKQQNESDRLDSAVRQLGLDKESLSKEVKARREQREHLESLRNTMQDKERQLGEREFLLERSDGELTERVKREQQEDTRRAQESSELEQKRLSIETDRQMMERSRLDLRGLLGLARIAEHGQETLEKASDSYQGLTNAVKGRIHNLETARQRAEALNRTLIKDKELLITEKNAFVVAAESNADMIDTLKKVQIGLEVNNKGLRETRDIAETRIVENKILLEGNKETISSLNATITRWRALARSYLEENQGIRGECITQVTIIDDEKASAGHLGQMNQELRRNNVVLDTKLTHAILSATQLQTDYNQFKMKLEKQEAALVKVSTEYSLLKSTKEELDKTMANSDQTLAKLRLEADELKICNSAYELEKAALSAVRDIELPGVKQQLERLNSDYKKDQSIYGKQIINLQFELAAAKQSRESTTRQVEHQEATINDLRARLDTERTRIRDLNQKVSEANAKFEALSAEMQEHKDARSKAEGKLRNVQEKASQDAIEHKKKYQELERAKMDAEVRLVEERKQLETRIAQAAKDATKELSRQIAIVQQKVIDAKSAHKKEIDLLLTKLQSEEDEHEATKRAQARQADVVEEAKKELAAKTDLFTAARNRGTELEKEIVDMKSDMTVAAKEKRYVEQRNSEMEIALDQLRSEVGTWREDYRQLKEIYNSSSNAETTANNALKDKEKDIKSLKDTNFTLIMSKYKLESTIRALQGEEDKRKDQDADAAFKDLQLQTVSKELHQAQETLRVQRSELEKWRTAPPHHAADTQMITSLEREKESLAKSLESIEQEKDRMQRELGILQGESRRVTAEGRRVELERARMEKQHKLRMQMTECLIKMAVIKRWRGVVQSRREIVVDNFPVREQYPEVEEVERVEDIPDDWLKEYESMRDIPGFEAIYQRLYK